MLAFLRDRTSDRKPLLFGCACCRRIWEYLHPSGTRVVELQELRIEGLDVTKELQVAIQEAQKYRDSDEGRMTEMSCSAAYAATSVREDYPGERGVWTASSATSCVQNTFYWIAYEAQSFESTEEQAREAGKDAELIEAQIQADILREIIGNPFQPIALDPAWQQSTVTALAQAAYDQRALPAGTLDPDRVNILADALEDAGCTDADILSHLRGLGPHVRGCWVVDLLLEKS
jgi:hypothetical protein